MMKKTSMLMLALAFLILIFAACSDGSEQNASSSVISDTTDTLDAADALSEDKTADTAMDTQPSDDIPALVKPWEKEPLNGTYISPQAEAICTVAEAYLARKQWLQYECTNIYETLPGTSRVRRTQQFVNTPEDCTGQNIGYTMCSFFVYDVFYQAFGVDIRQSGGVIGSYDMQVFYYEITDKETEQEKRAIEQRFLDTLQQGDIIVNKHRKSSGHVLIYIGDGMIIDSAYFSSQGGGNYDLSANKDLIEKNGSVRYREVMSFFEEDNYYYFWGEAKWGIVRPSLKHNLKITEQTQNRIDNLKNIYVEKLSSHTVGQSVDIGEEITFSFYIRNDRDTDAVLQVQAAVPQNTVYVSGGDSQKDGLISWAITIPAGKDTTVQYTVRVNEDESLYGTYISGEGSFVGGVNVRCRNIYVGKHLSDIQSRTLRNTLFDVSDIPERDMDMANTLYKKAGLELDLPETGELLQSLFKVSDVSAKHYVLNDSSPYIDMLVPTMYGGYYCCEPYTNERTSDVYGCKLYVGDILVAREKDNLYAYIYAGDGKVLSLKTGNMLYAVEGRDELLTMIGRDVFAVLRPSLAD